MPLKKRVANLDDVPEALRSMYVKKGDAFVLDTENDPDEVDAKKKANEFRENNIALSKQVQEMQEKLKAFEGVDPEQLEEAKKALDNVKSEEEKQLIREGRVDELVARRMQTAQKQWEKQLNDLSVRNKALEEENGTVNSKYSDLLIDSRVNDTVALVGVPRKNALVDIKNRVKQVFKINKKGDLEADNMYDNDGQPMKLDGYIRTLVTDVPYLWEQSGGSGSNGGRSRRENEPQKKVIANDPLQIGRNLEAIATGKMRVSGDDAPDDE